MRMLRDTLEKPERAGDKALVGLAGEYHMLAQLAERGYVGALTLGENNMRTFRIEEHDPNGYRDKWAIFE
jgi:hypothetical protein